MSYRYRDDLATADAAFEAEGGTLEELFNDAAVAMFEIMVDTGSVSPRVTKTIDLVNEDIDGLLFDWLSELVYLKDAEGVVFSRFDVKIKKNGSYELNAVATGENINRNKHRLRSDVKAVTYHMFEVKKTGDVWSARVVLDL
ncbi:MAG: archease [Candidatus Methanoperedens sp.]|nr:archease [Candidatus Methanoperedens sp.]